MAQNPPHTAFIGFKDLEDLFKANYKSLVSISYKITGDRESAEDIVQDCFFKLWKDRDRIFITVSLKAYLLRAVTNTSLNHIKSVRKLSTLEALPVEPFEGVTEDTFSEDIGRKVREAVEVLPPKCKAIFVLSRYEGLKYREIAEVLQISVKTVENQMVIAYEKLRERLKDCYMPLVFLFFLLFL